MRREPRVRRVYDRREAADGKRVLVDRLWPRGLSKEAAALDEWAKDVAPGPELRRWYGHRVDRYPEFARRYRAELDTARAREALDRLAGLVQEGPVTLLTATKDLAHAHTAVLADVLLHRDGDLPG
ncbi:DUF488 family protein [Streptomyces sp. P38-E01]|uniref:DUF488 family protein n=1 Tax=Streptomyces tardus TaxID=2780544 RepID=A0A949JGY8_9ACTN|nr:DUF488 family protein [Streptomyces tardus]MBU7599921.1 DUF488 family protein [Streptomyces tardus]